MYHGNIHQGSVFLKLHYQTMQPIQDCKYIQVFKALSIFHHLGSPSIILKSYCVNGNESHYLNVFVDQLCKLVISFQSIVLSVFSTDKQGSYCLLWWGGWGEWWVRSESHPIISHNELWAHTERVTTGGYESIHDQANYINTLCTQQTGIS